MSREQEPKDDVEKVDHKKTWKCANNQCPIHKSTWICENKQCAMPFVFQCAAKISCIGCAKILCPQCARVAVAASSSINNILGCRAGFETPECGLHASSCQNCRIDR